MVRSKKVISSHDYELHLTEILQYGIETFGRLQAKKYFNTISRLVDSLDTDHSWHPECRHLATKSHMYRNIVLDAHLVIYRITDERIEVLDIVHSASIVRRIRQTRSVRL